MANITAWLAKKNCERKLHLSMTGGGRESFDSPLPSSIVGNCSPGPNTCETFSFKAIPLHRSSSQQENCTWCQMTERKEEYTRNTTGQLWQCWSHTLRSNYQAIRSWRHRDPQSIGRFRLKRLRHSTTISIGLDNLYFCQIYIRPI